MIAAHFVSDLHGSEERYRALLALMAREAPRAVFLGGDLLGSPMAQVASAAKGGGDIIAELIAPGLRRLRALLRGRYPDVFVVPGNDDAASDAEAFLDLEEEGLLYWAHGRAFDCAGYQVYGYGCVPPTPFGLKDWERYDVSRFVDPGCIPPEEGWRTMPVDVHTIRYGTIARDLEFLAGDADLSRAVFLFHAPPHGTPLDRAALDGKMIDHVPLDVHVGSIAIKRFIERRQPFVTLHGHVHESARLTGSWRVELGRTIAMSAAHDGPELALVRFDLERPTQATRDLVAAETHA